MEMIEKAAPASTSPFSAIVRMFYEPAAVFAQLETRHNTWLPLLLLMGTGVITAVWYYQFVDFAWMQEQMLAAVADPEVREKQRAMGMSLQTVMGFTVIGIIVAYLVWFSLGGLYYLIVSKLRNVEFDFKKGFALSVWSSVPMLLVFPLSAMQILLSSSNQIHYEELNPLALDQLFFHAERGTALAGVLNALSIPMFLGVVLSVIGYQVWGKASRATAIKVAVTPIVVIYGGWLAYALS